MTPVTPSRLGRYFVVDRLGQGGMGVVYRAWDPQLQRAVALKVLSSSFDPVRQADTLERFLREARAAASLSHPNIVTVYDVGQQGGQPYLAMEFLEGDSLARLIGRHESLPLTFKLRLALQLCSGLGFAHARGVVHRDIKPANLHVTAGGDLKILDFGLAKLVGDLAQPDLTVSGAVVGTLRYMSPEQAAGRSVDERSDVFSVGAVLFELFTGRPAFESDVPIEAFRERTAPGRRSIRKLVPSLPAALDRVVATAMAVEPADRYQRLDEMAVDLRSVPRDGSVAGGGTDAGMGLPAGGRVDRELDDVLERWEQLVGQAIAAPDSTVLMQDEAARLTAPTLERPVAAPDPTRPRLNKPAAVSNRRFVWPVAVAGILVVLAIVLYVVFQSSSVEPRPALVGPVAPDQIGAASEITAVPTGEPPAPAASGAVGERAPIVDFQAPAGGGRAEGGTRLPAACVALLERVSLGEALTTAERAILAEQCRGGGR